MKKYLVIGSTGTIGEVVAKKLLKDRLTVLGVGQKISPLTEISDQYSHIQVNLDSIRDTERVISKVITENPDICGLVHCAGIGEFGNLENIAISKITRLININLISAIIITKLLIPLFRSNNSGNLIYLGSEAALNGAKKGSVYSASKFALRGFAQSIREETAKNNIAVTILNPGMIRGKFFDNKNFRPGKDEENAIKASDVAKLISFILEDRKGMILDEINLSQTKKVIDFL